MLFSRSSSFFGRRCEAVQKQAHHHVGKLLRLDIPLGVVPSVAEVEHAEQHHGADFLRSLDDLAFGIEPDQQIRHDVDELALKRLDGLLLGCIRPAKAALPNEACC